MKCTQGVRLGALVIGLLLAATVVHADTGEYRKGKAMNREDISENSKELRRLLRKLPEADLNGDGVLTQTEVDRFFLVAWQQDFITH